MGTPPHPQNPNNHSPPTNQRSARTSNDPRTLAGLHIGHSALGPRSYWSSPFVVRFLLSLSTILSRPTSDPFSPDTRVTITHGLYWLADSFVLTTHFISDGLLFCLPTLSELFPSFLANTYKHGPCTRTESSINSVWPRPVFVSFDIVRKAFFSYCSAD